MRRESNNEIVEISADVKLPGSDVLLEKGDRIEILKEEKIEERMPFSLLVVEYEGKFGTYTIYGSYSEKEVTAVVDEVGEDILGDGLMMVGRLPEIVDAVNTLLGPRVKEVRIT